MNKAIQRGIDLLTEKLGEGWQDRIDLERLDIGHCDDCVVGQLFAALDDYHRAVREVLHLNDDGEVSHGFSARDNTFEGWKNLNREWREYFETRKLRPS